MKQNILKVKTREESGKGVARKMRSKGLFPGVVYGSGTDPIAVTISGYEFQKMFSKTSGKNVLVDVEFEDGGESKKALVREVQTDPVTADILNIDLMLISMDKEITMSVPIKLVGNPVGVKDQGGILQFINREVEIACTPDSIPESVDIDVTEMEIGDTFHFGDIEGLKFRIISNPKISVCTVVPPTIIKERVTAEEGEEGVEGEEVAEEGAEEEQQEPEVITEKKDKEEE